MVDFVNDDGSVDYEYTVYHDGIIWPVQVFHSVRFEDGAWDFRYRVILENKMALQEWHLDPAFREALRKRIEERLSGEVLY